MPPRVAVPPGMVVGGSRIGADHLVGHPTGRAMGRAPADRIGSVVTGRLANLLSIQPEPPRDA